jgi:hypothetical protein
MRAARRTLHRAAAAAVAVLAGAAPSPAQQALALRTGGAADAGASAVQVREVSVRARRMPHSPPLQRFYERMAAGRGSFVTREQIAARRVRRLSDVFREIPGVRVASTPDGERVVMNGASPRLYAADGRFQPGECPVLFYVDGVVSLDGALPGDVLPDEVEGVEVYRRLSEVPVEFRRPGADCGVVLIWLREEA